MRAAESASLIPRSGAAASRRAGRLVAVPPRCGPPPQRRGPSPQPRHSTSFASHAASAPERTAPPRQRAAPPPPPPPPQPRFPAPTASLARAAAYSAGPGRVVVPLLTPEEHGVPFALALQLAEGSEGVATPRGLDAPRGAHALHFLLRGAACVALHDVSGDASQQPGDATDAAACGLAGPLLLRPGDCALSAPGARVSLQPAPGGALGDAVASLLLVLPKDDDDAIDASAAAAAARQWRSGPRAPPLGDAGAAALLRRSAAWARLASAPPEAAAASCDDASAAAPLRRRRLAELDVYRLPGQRNRVALLYDPLGRCGGGGVSFTTSVEIYDAGHVTPRHTHAAGTELFLLLSGTAVAVCDGVSMHLMPGDAVAFPPGAVHALDVPADAPGRCHALQLLLPDEGAAFAAFVRGGDAGGDVALDDADLCALSAAAQECPPDAQPAEQPPAALEWHR